MGSMVGNVAEDDTPDTGHRRPFRTTVLELAEQLGFTEGIKEL